MHRKAINRTPVASNCLLPTFWRHGRSRLTNGNEQSKSHTKPRVDSTNGRRDRIATRNRFIANDIRVGRLSDLVLCGLLGRNAHRDEGSMDGTRVKRNQHWVFWNLKASEAATDHKCEELAANAREWLVGLYGLDNGHSRRGDHGYDHLLYVCGGKPSVIQGTARWLLVLKNEGGPLGDIDADRHREP